MFLGVYGGAAWRKKKDTSVVRKYKTSVDVNSTKMDQVSERSKVTKEKEEKIENLLNSWEMKRKGL